MNHPVDILLSLVLLSCLFSFGSSRLPGTDQSPGFSGGGGIHCAALCGPEHDGRRNPVYHHYLDNPWYRDPLVYFSGY